MTISSERSQFLGGSDAAAVLGVSPYATPVELWMEKTGRKSRAEPDALRQKMLARGHKLEPFIRDMVVTKLQDQGMQVELIACNVRYVDPEYAFLSCEIDFELRLTGEIVIGDRLVQFDGEHVNADAKSVTGFARKKWGEEDTEDVPIEYAAQFMHGLMVTGRHYCLVAALRSFDDVDIYWTLRDDETIAAMRPKLVSFWVDHVLTGLPPDPLKFDDIKALFPTDNGLSIDATDEVAQKVAQLADIKNRIKVLEEQEDRLSFEVADYISPHAVLKFNGREIATWKGQQSSRLDQKALKEQMPEVAAKFTTTSTVRVLRLKKGI